MHCLRPAHFATARRGLPRNPPILSLLYRFPAVDPAPAVDRPISDAMARLEAVLLVAREPLSTRKLAHFAHLADGTQARTLLRRLNRHYESRQRAFRAEEVAGGFQLRTLPA